MFQAHNSTEISWNISIQTGMGAHGRLIASKCRFNKTRGLKLPPGCKISTHNSKVSIELNLANSISNNVAVVETIQT